jgi:hypothetical protein
VSARQSKVKFETQIAEASANMAMPAQMLFLDIF